MSNGDGLERRFRDLAAGYGAAVRRLCAVYAADQTDREDLFQDIWLAIWKGLPAFRGDASERTWLYSIAHNVALTWQARDRRRRRHRDGLEAAPPSPPDADVRTMALRQLIGRLSPVDRQLVTLWLEGVTPTEIGEITGMRPGTVAVRLTRIRQSMAEAMQETESHRG